MPERPNPDVLIEYVKDGGQWEVDVQQGWASFTRASKATDEHRFGVSRQGQLVYQVRSNGQLEREDMWDGSEWRRTSSDWQWKPNTALVEILYYFLDTPNNHLDTDDEVHVMLRPQALSAEERLLQNRLTTIRACFIDYQREQGQRRNPRRRRNPLRQQINGTMTSAMSHISQTTRTLHDFTPPQTSAQFVCATLFTWAAWAYTGLMTGVCAMATTISLSAQAKAYLQAALSTAVSAFSVAAQLANRIVTYLEHQIRLHEAIVTPLLEVFRSWRDCNGTLFDFFRILADRLVRLFSFNTAVYIATAALCFLFPSIAVGEWWVQAILEELGRHCTVMLSAAVASAFAWYTQRQHVRQQIAVRS